jgi:hypothetical protein
MVNGYATRLDTKEVSRDLSGIISDTQQIADSLSTDNVLGEASEEVKLLKRIIFKIKTLKTRIDQECRV